MFIHSLLVSIFALTHAVTYFFPLPKQCLAFIPTGGSSSVSTNMAQRQSSADLLLRSTRFVCQTDLTRVPSQGQSQSQEHIKTVKMATLTGSYFFPFGEGDDDEYI